MRSGAGRTLGRVTLTQKQQGALAVHLALTFPVWIRRRKTTFSYIDDTNIRQRQSIDFRLPTRDQLPPHARPANCETVCVPLYIADKESLVKFSITDEAGAALSLLNTVENGGFAAEGLNAIVNGLSGRPGRATVSPNSLRTVLRSIVMASGHRGPGVAERALDPVRPLGSVLTADDVYKALVKDLARGFLMLVPIPYEPERDRCLKIEYLTRQDWDPVGLAGVAWAVARISSSLAISDKTQGFTELQAGWARGTHFEVEAPQDVVLGEAHLDCVQWDPRHRRSIRIDARRTVYDRPVLNVNLSPRVNYDPHRDDPARRGELLLCRQDTADLTLRIRPRSAPVLLPVTLASAVTSALLWGALARLGELEGQTSAGLLLLIPALLAAFLARPGEHAFATRLLQGVRWATVLVLACAIVAVGVIAGGLIRGDAPSSTVRIECEPSNTGSGRDSRRTYRLTDLVCEHALPRPPEGEVRPEANLAVRTSAIVATLVMMVLCLGLGITIKEGWRRRAASDRSSQKATQPDGEPLPRAP